MKDIIFLLCCVLVLLSILFCNLHKTADDAATIDIQFLPLPPEYLESDSESSNHSRIQFKTMMWCGDVWKDIPHKIPLSTDTREMVKAGKYVEESDVINILEERHQQNRRNRDTNRVKVFVKDRIDARCYRILLSWRCWGTVWCHLALGTRMVAWEAPRLRSGSGFFKKPHCSIVANPPIHSSGISTSVTLNLAPGVSATLIRW